MTRRKNKLPPVKTTAGTWRPLCMTRTRYEMLRDALLRFIDEVERDPRVVDVYVDDSKPYPRPRVYITTSDRRVLAIDVDETTSLDSVLAEALKTRDDPLLAY